MRKGQSYILITSEGNPNHPIIKALTEIGVGKAEVIFASHLSSSSGWDMVTCNIPTVGRTWLGYTISSALLTINRMIVDKEGFLSHK